MRGSPSWSHSTAGSETPKPKKESNHVAHEFDDTTVAGAAAKASDEADTQAALRIIADRAGLAPNQAVKALLEQHTFADIRANPEILEVWKNRAADPAALDAQLNKWAMQMKVLRHNMD